MEGEPVVSRRELKLLWQNAFAKESGVGVCLMGGRRQCSGRIGFTMVEMLISVFIGVLVVGGALSVFIYGLRTWKSEAIKNELQLDLENALEHIRHDLRLSSVGVGLMAFYPSNATEYTAISFPLSSPDTNGLLRRDLDTNSPNYGRMIWDQTVVYHVRPGQPDKLIRTVFSPRNTNATADQFYAQLVQVVHSANDADLQAAAMAGESVASRVVFQNLVSLRIRPPTMLFDGYAPAYQRGPNFNWGSVVLGAGTHDLTFTVVGKNAASTGYKVGVDWFSLSPSASRREGEMFLPINSHPQAPFYQIVYSNGAAIVENMSGYGASWSGNAQLTFLASNVGDAITFKVYNDLWCDTHFDLPPGIMASNCSRKCDGSFTSQPPYIADYVISMDKGIAWLAESCVDGTAGSINLAADASITNIIYGATSNTLGTIVCEGARARLNFYAATNGQLFIDNVVIKRLDTGATCPVTFNTGSSWVKVAAGGNVWSDWLNFAIQRSVSYLIGFQLKTEAAVLANAKTWSATFTNPPLSFLNGAPHNQIIGLAAVEVLYPTNALYRSGIFDTRIANPAFQQLSWTHVEPFPAGDLDVRVRSGDLPDLSDACPWEPLTYFQANPSNSIGAIAGGRYVQYEALFTSSGDHTQTAKLRDLTITWQGVMGLVDLVVGFARGPDYGVIKAEVDGRPLVKGIEVEMEIFKAGPFGTNRVSGVMEVRPLNTGR